MDIQTTFEKNASKLDSEVVACAINEGIERARMWQYPDTFWTTSISFAGYMFEIHKPKDQQPGILNFRKVI